jgi:transcriptional regulator with XRE-family HTH domain
VENDEEKQQLWRERGARIQALRLALGLNQVKLAALIGVSHQALQQWEQGKSDMKADNLLALLVALETSLTDIVGTHVYVGDRLRRLPAVADTASDFDQLWAQAIARSKAAKPMSPEVESQVHEIRHKKKLLRTEKDMDKAIADARAVLESAPPQPPKPRSPKPLRR